MMRKDKLPVLVFVHGPSYNWGSGNPYDGSFLAWYGELIVITLNYRLGAFGFLPTESDGGSVRGNYGLLDLIASLHWIQDNIAQFGGDPSNITLVGHNRGASLVHLLMLSQMSKNLFHRAVLISGSALSPWAISTQSQYFAKQLADKLACNGNSPNSLSSADSLTGKEQSNQRSNSAGSIECLRTRSAESINNVELETAEPLRSSFGPIVDGLLVPIDPSNLVNTSQNNLGNAFQSNLFSLNFGQHRSQANQSPSFNALYQVNKPLLFGVTRVETPPFIFNKAEQQKGISSRRKGEIIMTLVSNMFNYYQEAISLTLINEYTDWSAGGSEQNFIDSLIDILGDALVVAPLTNAVSLHLKLTGQKGGRQAANNVYSYVFVYQPEMSSLQSARLGCVHGEELQLIFGAPIARHQFGIQLRPFQANYSPIEEVTLSKQLIANWANFAKYSNPNGKDDEVKNNLQSPNVNSQNLSNINLPDSTLWPNYDQQRRYLMLGLKSKPRDHYHAHRLSLWLQLIPKLQFQGRFEMEQLKRTIKEKGNAFQQQILNSNLNQNSNSLSVDQQSDPSKSYLNQWLDSLIERLINRIHSILHFNNNPSSVSNTFEYHFLMTIAQQLTNSNLLNTATLSQNASSKARSSSTPYNLINKPHSLSTSLFSTSDYSTALGLIIAIGLMLLLFNMLVFLWVYVYRRRKANNTKKDDQQHRKSSNDDSNNNKVNNSQLHQQKKARTKSIDCGLTNSNLDARNMTASYLPMAGNLTNSITNSLSNAYAANQSTGPSAIYGQAQHTYYYNANSELTCLPSVANVNTGQATNNALTNTLSRRGGELDFSDYCCSSADEQHLCIYNTADRTGANSSSMLKMPNNPMNTSNSLNANNLNVTNELNRCSANSNDTNSNGQHSTVNCLSQNSQLSGISCQCDNCTTIHTLNNGIVTGQATLLNANLVNLVNSSLCGSNQCNLTVIHEFEERL